MKRIPLTETHIRRLAEYGLQNVPRDDCACLVFAPGETVLSEGEAIYWYSVVISGRARVCRTAENGRTLTIWNYDSEGMIGEIELLTDQEVTSTAIVAVSEFVCVAINYSVCRAELYTNTVFLRKLGAGLAQKLMHSSEGYSAAALCSGEQRLCAHILRVSHRGMFSDVLTDASCSVGMSYRHLFRLLGRLCEEGVLEKCDSGYRILDQNALERRARAIENDMWRKE